MASWAGRYFRSVLLSIGALSAVLILAALGPLRDSFWGFHLYAFLPPFAVVTAMAALIAGAWALLHPLPLRLERTPRPGIAVSPAIAIPLVGVAFGIAFWVLRSRQTLLGDAYPILLDVPKGVQFHPRQPLAVWIQQAFYRAVSPLIQTAESTERAVAHVTVGILSVAFGVLFVLLVVALVRGVFANDARDRMVPWLLCGLLLSQGYMQLFFGYVENYAPQATFVAAYALCALLYLRRRTPLAAVAIVFVITLGMHLSSITLLPSFALLAYQGLRARERRRDATLGLLAFALALVGLDVFLRSLASDYSLASGLASIAHVAQRPYGGGSGLAYTFSAQHLRDFLNSQFLVGPLSSFLLVPAIALVLWRWRADAIADRSRILFMILLAVPSLLAAFVMSEPQLGYARDWDIVAAPAVSHAIAGAGLLLMVVRDATEQRRLLGFALVLSLVQLVPWVWINHSEARSLERFATLPLGGGRTEVVVGRVYLERGGLAEAERWFRAARRESPTNSLAHAFLGETLERRGDHDGAAAAYGAAVDLRPDKVEYRRGYANALVQIGALEPAVTQLETLAQQLPEDVATWRTLSAVLARLGRIEESGPVNERLLGLLEARLREEPGDVDGWIDAGVAALHLGRPEEALRHFRQAIRIDPDSEGALYNCGRLLLQLGRETEARPLLTRLVARHPRHAETDWIQKQLVTSDN